MTRRFALALILAIAVAGCVENSRQDPEPTPELRTRALARKVEAIAAQVAPGVVGVGVMNLASGETWDFNGQRPFPMQSVFKAPLGAAVLAEVDAGRLRLDETITLAEEDLSPPFSPIAGVWPGRRSYTAEELLLRAVGASDNTAADVLMARIGGPGAVTAWLRAKDIHGVRIDRYERQLQPESLGLEPFRAAWRTPAAYLTALSATPEPRRRAAAAAYLADPRDTATPRAMLVFLAKLDRGDLLSAESTARLTRIMTDTLSGPDRLKAGLPKGASLAHKTGTSMTAFGVNAATNDVGVVTLADGRRYAVAVFLSGARLEEAEREAVIAEIMQAIIHAIG